MKRLSNQFSTSVSRSVAPRRLTLWTSMLGVFVLTWWSTLTMASGLPEFTDLVEEHKDAVVNISTTRTVTQSPRSLGGSTFGPGGDD